jgi:hypothetical protein
MLRNRPLIACMTRPVKFEGRKPNRSKNESKRFSRAKRAGNLDVPVELSSRIYLREYRHLHIRGSPSYQRAARIIADLAEHRRADATGADDGMRFTSTGFEYVFELVWRGAGHAYDLFSPLDHLHLFHPTGAHMTMSRSQLFPSGVEPPVRPVFDACVITITLAAMHASSTFHCSETVPGRTTASALPSQKRKPVR